MNKECCEEGVSQRQVCCSRNAMNIRICVHFVGVSLIKLSVPDDEYHKCR